MKSRLEILVTINNQVKELTLSEDAQNAPRIFKRAIDTNKLSTAVGDVTLGLKLPKDSNNRAIFNFADEIDNAFGFFQVPDYNCQVLVDSIVILEGQLRLDEYTPKEIKATIFGNNIAWKSVFENKNLRDLKFETILFSGVFGANYNNWFADGGTSPDLDTKTYADIWLTKEEDNQYPMQFPYIAYANYGWPTPESTGYSGFNQDNPDALWQKMWESKGLDFTNFLLRNEDVPFHFLDLIPALYLKKIIQQIFLEGGFTVSGTFMADPEINNIIIPFIGSQDQLFNSYNWGLLARYKARSLRNVGYSVLPSSSQLWYPSGIYEGWGLISPAMQTVQQTTGFSWTLVERDYVFSYNYSLLPENFVNPVPTTFGNFDQWDYKQSAGENFADNNYYICPLFGKYQVELSFRVFNNTNSLAKARIFVTNNFTPGVAPQQITDSSLVINAPATIAGATSIIDILPNNNQIINLNFEYDYNTITSGLIKPFLAVNIENSNSQPEYIVVQVINFQITPVFNAETMPTRLQPANFLPDLNIESFISAISKQFNLEFTLNNNTISIDYRNNNSNSTSISKINFSEKCNLRDQATLKKGVGQQNYRFSQEKFENASVLYDTRDKLYLSGLQNVKEEKIELKFVSAGSRNTIWVSTPQNNFTSVQFGGRFLIPNLCETEEFNEQMSDIFQSQEISYEKPMTLLKWQGISNIGTINSRLWVGAKTYLAGTLPNFGLDLTTTANFTPGDFPYATTLDLTPTAVFETFYKVYLENLKTKIIIEVPILWTALDLTLLNLRQAFEIEGQLFRIAEISGFNPLLKNPTKTKLLKL